jgi:hypothetical protein
MPYQRITLPSESRSGTRTRQVPPIGAVGRAGANFALERLSAREACAPLALDRLDVVGMERLPPTLVGHVLGSEPGDLEGALVDGTARAVGTVDPDQHRDVVDRHLQLALGFDRLLLGSLAILDVRDRSVPRNYLSGVIAQRGRSKQEPAILAVETPQARLAVERLPGGHVCTSDVDKLVEVVGMNARFPSPPANLLGRRARVFKPALVELLHIAIGSAPPGYRGDRIQGDPQFTFGLGEPGLALPQRLLGDLLVLDVDSD